MTIGPHHLTWLRRLPLGRVYSVLDVGPQDVELPVEVLRDLVGDGVARMNFRDGMYRDVGPLWEALGAASYAAFDVLDPRALLRGDLNRHTDVSQQFDVVINFGTLEHIANVGEAFDYVHRATTAGGLMLHAMPALGPLNHGYYAVQPILYTDLARVNDYEVVDLEHVILAADRPVDLVFAALRKTHEAPLTWPTQGCFA